LGVTRGGLAVGGIIDAPFAAIVRGRLTAILTILARVERGEDILIREHNTRALLSPDRPPQ